jgi:dTDP-4-dehydrorhamnose 3,5-epimerase-like enzyme
MIPEIIEGGSYTDSRGTLFYNNDFDASLVKRMYVIGNQRTDFARGWQGHKIEQRWFSAMIGSFKIQLIEIDNWEHPTKNLERLTYKINSEKLEVLHVPKGYVSSIQSLEKGSKLLVMSNYSLNEINDEFRFSLDHFI